MKTKKEDFIIYNFTICAYPLEQKWFIIKGNNIDDLYDGDFIGRDGLIGIYPINRKEFQFNSRREAIGYLKKINNNVNIVKELLPGSTWSEQYEDDEEDDEDYSFLNDDDDDVDYDDENEEDDDEYF